MLNPEAAPLYRLGSDFLFQPQRRSLERGGVTIPLPSRAFDVLAVLVAERHRAVTKEELSERVWGEVAVTQNNLNQSITALRKALGDTRQAGQFIATIPNVGYQFVAPVTLIDEPPVALPVDPIPSRPRVVLPPRALAICGLLAVAAGLGAWRWHGARTSSLAVIPFVNLQQDDNFDWLSPSLARFCAAAMPGGSTVNALPAELPRQLPSTAEIRALAAQAHAHHALVGAFSVPARGQILLRITLHDTSGEPAGPGVEATGPLNDFPALAAGLLRQLGAANRDAPDSQTARYTAIQQYSQGLTAWRVGDLPAALPSFRKGLFFNPNDPLLLSGLGAVLGELGHVAEPALLHERALQLAAALPPDQKLLVEARHLASRGDWPRAIEAFRSLWLRAPDRLEAALELAAAQFRARQASEARQTIETTSHLIAGFASDPRVLLLRARLEGHFGNMEQVRTLAAKAADNAHQRALPQVEARARMLQSGATQNLGRLAEAAQLREQVKASCATLEDTACLSAAWRVQGNAELSQHPTQAAAAYRTALRMSRLTGNPTEQAHVLNGVATAMLQDGQPAQAEKAFRDLLHFDLNALGLSADGVSIALAEALYQQGRFSEAANLAADALRHSEAAAQKEPAAKAALVLARTRQAEKNTSAVAALYEKALSLFAAVGNPELTKEALVYYARFLVERRQLERAQSALQQAASYATPLHAALYQEADAELRQARHRRHSTSASASPD